MLWNNSMSEAERVNNIATGYLSKRLKKGINKVKNYNWKIKNK